MSMIEITINPSVGLSCQHYIPGSTFLLAAYGSEDLQ
jgi:hypothetical protein